MQRGTRIVGRFMPGLNLAWILIAGTFVGVAGDAPAIHFLAPVGPVTGTVTVVVQTQGSNLLLDYSMDDRATWVDLAPIFEDGLWRAEWVTDSYSGSAVLRARSEESSSEIDVVVDNTPPRVALTVSRRRFSPNGDGRMDRTTFSVGMSESGTLRLEVLDKSGVPRRSWGPETIGRRATSFSWRGRGGGETVPDGRYTVRASVSDAVGLLDETQSVVWIDTVRPRIRSLKVASPTDASGPVKIRYRVQDASPRVRLRFQLRDEFGLVRTRSVERHTGWGAVEVKPRRHNGHRLFPSGYRIFARATDLAANRRSRSRPLLVLRYAAPRAFSRLENTGRKVALTFDDCIYSDAWARILDILNRREVKATFFCSGDRVALYPDLARRVVKEGHTPASHGWGHPWLTLLSPAEIENRLTLDRKHWASVGGVSVPYFRPPYGAYNSTVLEAAARAFYPRAILWDVDAGDTRGASGGALVCNVVCNARPGSIILMHIRPVTAAVISEILDGLAAKKLRPVTLPQLFRAAGFR